MECGQIAYGFVISLKRRAIVIYNLTGLSSKKPDLRVTSVPQRQANQAEAVVSGMA